MKRSLIRTAATAILAAVLGAIYGCGPEVVVFREADAPVVNAREKALADIVGCWKADDDDDDATVCFKPSHIVMETGDIVERYDVLWTEKTCKKFETVTVPVATEGSLQMVEKEVYAMVPCSEGLEKTTETSSWIAFPVAVNGRRYLFVLPGPEEIAALPDDARDDADFAMFLEVGPITDSEMTIYLVATDAMIESGNRPPMRYDEIKDDLLAGRVVRSDGDDSFEEPSLFKRMDDAHCKEGQP